MPQNAGTLAGMAADYPGVEASTGERIEWARAQAGLSKGSLAEMIGASASRVSEWTRRDGAVQPRPESISALAEVLDVDAGWLSSGYGAPYVARASTSPNAESPTTVGMNLAHELLSLARAHGWALSLDLQIGSMKVVVEHSSDELVSVDEWRAEQLSRAGGGEPIGDYAARRDAAARDLERELESEAQRLEERRSADAEGKRDPRRRGRAS